MTTSTETTVRGWTRRRQVGESPACDDLDREWRLAIAARDAFDKIVADDPQDGPRVVRSRAARRAHLTRRIVRAERAIEEARR